MNKRLYNLITVIIMIVTTAIFFILSSVLSIFLYSNDNYNNVSLLQIYKKI